MANELVSIVADPGSSDSEFVNAVRALLDVPEGCDLATELRLQKDMVYRVTSMLATLNRQVMAIEHDLKQRYRELAVQRKDLEAAADEQIDVAKQQTWDKIEADYRAALGEGEKLPAQTRIEREVRANPAFIGLKQSLRAEIAALADDPAAAKLEASLRLETFKRDTIKGLFDALRSRRDLLYQLGLDQQREWNASGRGHFD